MYSPNLRTNHSQENQAAITRKPDLNPPTARKPFVDRSVNETPFEKIKFPIKSHLTEDKKIQDAKIKTPTKKYPDWLLDTCSYRDVFDDCWDIRSSTTSALQAGLTSYFQYRTPSPILKNIDTFFELPMFNIMTAENPINFCGMEEIDDEPPIPLVDF